LGSTRVGNRKDVANILSGSISQEFLSRMMFSFSMVLVIICLKYFNSEGFPNEDGL
jgi:hypothetical protein